MSLVPPGEVFTIQEIARAAGVPVEAVRTLLGRGELSFVPGTRFIGVNNAPRAARRLQETALTLHTQAAKPLFAPGDDPSGTSRKPVFLSLLAHATLVLLAVWLSTGRIETAPLDDSIHEESHLVFLVSPGPGSGGGGGGLRQPRPAPKIARRGQSHLQVSVPPISEKPVLTTAREEAPKPTPVEPVFQAPPPQPAPEPVPAKVIVAPVETAAANDRDREGTIEHAVEGRDSNGPGRNGGVGSGQGTGNGEGVGTGIGEGEGGGTGGGPYRP